MIDVILVANYTPEKGRTSADAFHHVKEQSYLPILNLLEELSIPAVHCFSAYTLELFREYHAEDYLDRLQVINNVGRAEMASKGFCDAPLSQLPEIDMRQQLILAHEIESDRWGASPGFFASEGWLDPLAISLLHEQAFLWAIVAGSSLTANGMEYTTALGVLKQKGLEEHSLDILSTFDDQNQTFSKNIANVFSGQTDIRKFVNELSRIGETQKKYRPLMVLDFAMEVPLLSNATVALQKFKFFLQSLESIGSFNFLLPSKVIGKTETEAVWISPKSSPRRLELMILEARNVLTTAMKKEPGALLLKKAWHNLLLAQSATVSETIARSNTVKDKTEMAAVENVYLRACTRAWTAKKIAQDVAV
jgi:hypothetical protein